MGRCRVGNETRMISRSGCGMWPSGARAGLAQNSPPKSADETAPLLYPMLSHLAAITDKWLGFLFRGVARANRCRLKKAKNAGANCAHGIVSGSVVLIDCDVRHHRGIGRSRLDTKRRHNIKLCLTVTMIS